MTITQDSFERKAQYHGVSRYEWKYKVKDWVKITVDYIFSEEFEKILIDCDSKFGDEWIWSTSAKHHFYFVHSEDALVFKLKYYEKEPA